MPGENDPLNGKVTRRQFIKIASSTALGMVLAPFVITEKGLALGSKISVHRVVRIHDLGATCWDYTNGFYGDYVDQNIVTQMVNRGLMELTEQSTPQSAWGTIMSEYTSGDKIAIRVNFNNCYDDYNDSDNIIDSIIEPVNAVVDGLVNIGIPASDIYVFDASRVLPLRFTTRSLHPVNFCDRFGEHGNLIVTYNKGVTVQFSNPNIPTYHEVADVLVDAQHLIAIPLMKAHTTGVTGGFKLHLGTIFGYNGQYTDIHPYLYDESNNPLGDIYQNEHIRLKTRLLIGDGLFGARHAILAPERWSTFGSNAPNSLFFSFDPVALDSVMLDILHAEWPNGPPPDNHNHLHYAHSLGLGIHEHYPYNQIEYVQIELDSTMRDDIDRAIKRHKEGRADDEEVEGLIEHYYRGE